MTAPGTTLDVLIVDDEQPALDELAYLLGRDPRVGRVQACASATDALRLLREQSVDGIFLDVEMPGLSGLELAGLLEQFRAPLPVVFVTAHDEHAVEAFDVRAVDFLLKPVHEARLAEAVRRLAQAGQPTAPSTATQPIAVERGGVTRLVPRSEVRYVSAEGDYVRLHTGTDHHLVRVPIGTLEHEWAGTGFVRIHRSLLVGLAHVEEVRTAGGRCSVVVGGVELQVSRRHTPALREMLRGTRP